MANQVQNPFEDEKPQLVHFEKSESHYEYCRMQMHEIERAHRRTFFAHIALCVAVCFFSIFQKYIGGFDLLSRPFAEVDAPGAILAGGIFQIVIAMILIVLGYLAWANFHSLNIILETWYVIVTLVGIFRLDYLTALIGIVGAVFYFFALREMGKEQTLSEMEGYPDFQEKFDISKSDIVIQTLLAHQGERRTKSTLFTTDYSLRRMKKKKNPELGAGTFPGADKDESSAGSALAEVLQKSLDDVKDARQARTAIAALDAVTADIERTKESKPEQQQPAESEAADEAETAAMSDILPETEAESAAEPETAEADAAPAPEIPKEKAASQNNTQKKPAQNRPDNSNHAAQNRQNPNNQNRKKKKKKK